MPSPPPPTPTTVHAYTSSVIWEVRVFERLSTPPWGGCCSLPMAVVCVRAGLYHCHFLCSSCSRPTPWAPPPSSLASALVGGDRTWTLGEEGTFSVQMLTIRVQSY